MSSPCQNLSLLFCPFVMILIHMYTTIRVADKLHLFERLRVCCKLSDSQLLTTNCPVVVCLFVCFSLRTSSFFVNLWCCFVLFCLLGSWGNLVVRLVDRLVGWTAG